MADASDERAGGAHTAAVPRRVKLFRAHARGGLELADEGEEAGARVTNIELFFDLVFVFGVTQLSHSLLANLTPVGAAQTLLLLVALWWLWIYTSWATNWLDPERPAIRVMLIAMMMGGLLLAAAIPSAFGGHGAEHGEGGSAEDLGWLFVATYVPMQLLRTLLVAWASRGVNEARMRNFLRIAFFFLLSAPFWVWGAFAEPEPRLLLWTVAMAIELSGPALGFRTPGLGRARLEDWNISGAHMAERCGLFIIIALGEAIVVTGATFAGLERSPAGNLAFAVSFLGSALMWWIYFDTGAKQAGEAIEQTPQTGRLARSAYTYLHLPIVAGIVVTAVGDELLLAHPLEPVHADGLWTLFGGPFLFLAGTLLFKWVTANRKYPPLSHGVGMTLLLALAGLAWWQHWPTLAAGGAAMAALLLTAAWEWLSLNGGWRRWTRWGREAAGGTEGSG